MNEKDIIKNLSTLKDVTPSTKRVNAMKGKLLREINGENMSKLPIRGDRNFPRPQYFVFLVLLILIAIVSIPYTQKKIQPAVYLTRIALTNNHYEKSKLAFEEAQMELQAAKSSDTSTVPLVMSSTSTTNEYISHLHLQGEKGKYTAEECKQLYQEYAIYLSTLRAYLQQQKQQTYAVQISQYQKQASSRLAYYKT